MFKEFKPIKQLGQNFLQDQNVANQMIDALNLQHGDVVVEIGPGLGILTEKLFANDKIQKIFAIDIDDRFVEKLKKDFEASQKINVIKANILDWLPQFHPDTTFKVIGSLPYFITSPIIHAIVKHAQISTAVVMIQKEVGAKIFSLAPDGSYFSNFVHAFYTVSKIVDVPRALFDPVPNVDSVVVKLEVLDKPFVSHEKLRKFEGFLHRGFANPRKMINKAFPQEYLSAAGIDSTTRPEHVLLEKWVKLFELITPKE